jgi:hypothetical protein
MRTAFTKLALLSWLGLRLLAAALALGPPSVHADYYDYHHPFRDRSDCITEACDRGVTCAFEDNLKKVVQACRFVDGECVEVACQAGASCSFETTLYRVIQACRGVDPDCVTAACNRGGINCAFESSLLDVLERCGP